ncbi:MAG: LacI family DNA-binding transcriptional regulator [Alphaproteobacteria bacterium]|nr:MAG: LacI family DNA-binding transcriptional regulator [Alphaproteobacteria bacterium]
MSDDKSAKITIADVARVAGVSVTTVSRVLNGEKYVREDKKNAVMAAVSKLQYQPNLFARSLAGDRSYLIGLLFDDPRGDYLSGMQRGAMQRSQKAGLHLVVELFEKGSSLADIESFLTKLQLTGVILAPPVCDNKVVLAALHKKRIPTVRIAPSAPYDGMPSVVIDDFHAAGEVAEYLIAKGHKDIGFIRGDREHADAHERENAFRDVMQKHGLPVRDQWVGQGDYSFESGVAAARKILSNAEKPTAIFACNDDMAAGVIVAADEIGLHVPADLSVAGYDDIALASRVSPPLTTVRQPVEEMAAQAVERLLAMREGTDIGAELPTVMKVEFIERHSVVPPRQK